MKELLAYTAGFIDADGYIGLIKVKQKNSYALKVKVANTNFEIIDFLVENFGGHRDKPRFQNMPNRKPAVMWSLSNAKNVIPFLKKIVPYLTIKKERAELLIKYDKECTGIKTEEAHKTRKEIYKKMRILNRRGLPPATTE